MPRQKKVYPRECACGFLAKHKQSWYSHKRCCDRIEETKEDIDELRTELNALKNKLDELKVSSTIQQNHALQGITNNNNVINNYNQSNNFNINLHGKEDMSHITQQLLEFCVKHGNDGVMRLIEEVMFNPKKPENQNMRIKTMKDFRSGYIEVFGPEGWEVTMKHPVYGRVWKQMFREINNLYGNWEWEDCLVSKLGNKHDIVKRFMDKGEYILGQSKDCEVPREYIKPIDCLVLKNHNKIKS